MLMWSQYAGHLYLRHPTPEDVAHFEAEQGFQVRLQHLFSALLAASGRADVVAVHTNHVP